MESVSVEKLFYKLETIFYRHMFAQIYSLHFGEMCFVKLGPRVCAMFVMKNDFNDRCCHMKFIACFNY
jgi:hypothetical protein